MSQAGLNNTSSGPLPPGVPTTFVTDVNSPSVPVANIENVFGGTSSSNNTNGIQTDGSSGGNTLTVQLTNRVSAAVTTANAAVTPIITFALGATPASYIFDISVVALDVTDSLGAGYSLFGTIRTNGIAATVVGTPDKIVNEEGAMSAAQVDLTASGNNAVVNVTGLAGKTIDWNSLLIYTKVT